MDYILKLNLLTQQELHHLVTTKSDSIFSLICFICRLLVGCLFPCIPPTPVSCEAAHWMESSEWSTFCCLALLRQQWCCFFTTLSAVSWWCDFLTQASLGQLKLHVNLLKGRWRPARVNTVCGGSQGHSLLVLNVEEKCPITGPVGSKHGQG